MKAKLNRASLTVGVFVASSFLSWLTIFNETVAFATASKIVALQSGSGKYLGRCNQCIPGASNPDSVR
jgi:hypothetical protein